MYSETIAQHTSNRSRGASDASQSSQSSLLFSDDPHPAFRSVELLEADSELSFSHQRRKDSISSSSSAGGRLSPYVMIPRSVNGPRNDFTGQLSGSSDHFDASVQSNPSAVSLMNPEQETLASGDGTDISGPSDPQLGRALMENVEDKMTCIFCEDIFVSQFERQLHQCLPLTLDMYRPYPPASSSSMVLPPSISGPYLARNDNILGEPAAGGIPAKRKSDDIRDDGRQKLMKCGAAQAVNDGVALPHTSHGLSST